MHLHFGAPLTDPGDTPEAVASAIDAAIHEGFHLWPTHGEAYRRLTGQEAPPLHDAQSALKSAVRTAFEARLGESEALDRWVLRQYAAPVALALKGGAAGLGHFGQGALKGPQLFAKRQNVLAPVAIRAVIWKGSGKGRVFPASSDPGRMMKNTQRA